MDVPRIFGRYQPIRLLGMGAASRVMLVKDLLKDEEECALKVLMDEAAAEGFEREFKILSSINHPLVIKVFDFGQDDSGLKYFSMEYVLGKPLEEVVSDQLSVARIRLIAEQLLTALAAIHARGVLHADLKPGNIFLVQEEDGSEHIKLLDFGLAGLRTDADAGERRGTLEYMAPEWFNEGEVDFRSDLYSSGIILYELLAGGTPFKDLTPDQTIQAKLGKTPPSALEARDDCPPELSRLVSWLLERDPVTRPTSASDALKVLGGGEGTRATDGGAEAAVLLSGLPFVGRHRTMARIQAAREAAMTSFSGHMYLLSSDAGGGKTRMLQELKGFFQREGMRILAARGLDVKGQPPLQQLLYRPVKLDGEANQGLIKRYDSVLRQVFGDEDEGGAVGETRSLTDSERLGLVDGLGSFLLELAARHPLVIVLDDLHEADPTTQALMAHLGWQLQQAPLLICTSVDEAWLGGHEGFQELLEQKEVAQLPLEPLSVDDLRSALDEAFGEMTGAEALPAALQSFAGGNPEMVIEAMELLVNRRAIYTERGRWYVSEEGVAEVLAPGTEVDRARSLLERRLMPLEPAQRALLSAAAVLGAHLTRDALHALDPEQASADLDVLVQLGLLVKLSHPKGGLTFQQPRLQRYLLEVLEPAVGATLHLRAGEFLLSTLGTQAEATETGEGLEDGLLLALAQHFLAASDPERGRRFGVLAAQRAEQNQAWRESLDLYQGLLALAEAQGDPAPSDVREKIGCVLQQLSQMEQALAIFDALLAAEVDSTQTWLAPGHHPIPAPARFFYRRSELRGALGELEAALKDLDRAADLLPEASVVARVHIEAARVAYQLNLNTLEAAEASAKRGLGLIGDPPSRDLLADALNLNCLLANVVSLRHQGEEAEGYLKTALALSKGVPPDLPASVARVVRMNIAELHFMRGRSRFVGGDYPEALAAWLEAARHFESLRDLHYLSKCYNNMGVVYFHMGEWQEAIDHWERFRDIVERSRDKLEIINACVNLGWVYKETGQLEEAGQAFETGLKLARSQNLAMMLPTLLGNLGEQKVRMGEGAEGRKLFTQAVNLARELENHSEEAENLRRLAEQSLEEGRPTRARREVNQGLEVARKAQVRSEEANLLAIKGAEAAARGLTDRSLEAFRAGEEILKELGAEFERARLKYRQGLAYNTLGFPSEAESALRSGEDTFRKLGATWELKRTREAIRALGSEGGGNALAFKKLQLLLDATRTLGAEVELEPLLNRMLEKAVELTQAERGFVILFDEAGAPTFHATRSLAREDVEGGETAQLSSTVIERVVATGEPLAVTNVDQEFDLRAQASIVALGLRSIMCVPLTRGDKVLGVIYVDSSKITEEFYEADTGLLQALADGAAIALENAQLVASLRRKTDLMSYLAHEFRSPITASIAYSNQLLRERKGLNDDQVESIEAIQEQGHRLHRMINNILELSRMEASKVDWWMEELLIDQVLGTTIRGMTSVAREKQVTIRMRPDGPEAIVYGNPDRLIQVCTNILGNSLKFTPERGTIEIYTELSTQSARLKARGGRKTPAGESWINRNLGAGKRLSETELLMVRIQDSGPGIPKEDLERVFGKFSQSGDRQSKAKGTGLGLTIAREIVQQHGGRMWAENGAGGGALFSFSLPLVVSG